MLKHGDENKPLFKYQHIMNQFPAYNSITEETRNTDGYLIIITHKHKRGTDRNGQAASTPVPRQPGINKSPQRPHPLHIINVNQGKHICH